MEILLIMSQNVLLLHFYVMCGHFVLYIFYVEYFYLLDLLKTIIHV